MSPYFSFIIPAYNAEKTLSECLDNILSRKNEDYEIIVVNDGSKDQTGKICDAYGSKYSFVRVFHVPNAGAAAARNLGISQAQGDYILFCDSDDLYNATVFSDTLDQLKPMLRDDTLQCFDFRDLWPDHIGDQGRYSTWSKQLLNDSDIVSFLSCRESHKHIGYSIWTKIYSRKVILENYIRFPERDRLGNKDDWSEDMAFNLQYCSCIRSISVIDVPMYYLRKHGTPEEQSEHTLINRIDHMSNLFRYILSFYESQGKQIFVNEFYKLFSWHMHRYFHAFLSCHSVKDLRKQIIEYPKSDFIMTQLQLAYRNKNHILHNLSPKVRKDCLILIEYILKGNYLSYTVKNYFLWKIIK